MIKLFTTERKERISKLAVPGFGRLRRILPGAIGNATHEAQEEPAITVPETPEPQLKITKSPKTALAITMASATVSQYVESGLMSRLSMALERYSSHFDEVVLVTPDRESFTEHFGIENVTHVPVKRSIPGPWILKMSVSVALQFKAMRGATVVLALDEAGAAPGWLISRLSGCQLVLSAGAPWAPPRPKRPFDGLKAWPVRQAVKRISDVTLWDGESGRPRALRAESHRLPAYVDAELYSPLVMTDPERPRMVGAFLSASDTESAMGLMGAADTLKRDGHDLMFRVFLLASSGAEAKAAELQAGVVERSAPIEFIALPRIELLPDVISRLRICLSFGADHALPFTLRALSAGVPCVVAGVDVDDRSGRERDWRDYVIRTGNSNRDIVRAIESLLREPLLRLRLGREGRRLVMTQHSLDAIAAKEVAILKRAQTESNPEVTERSAEASSQDRDSDLGVSA